LEKLLFPWTPVYLGGRGTPFSYQSRGRTYYLYGKAGRYFFTTRPDEAEEKGARPIENLPPGMQVKVSPRSGLPILKKIEETPQEEVEAEQDAVETLGEQEEDEGEGGIPQDSGAPEEALPPKLEEMLEEGWSPTFKKSVSRWYLQKRVGNKVLGKVVPRRYDRIMEQIKRQKDLELEGGGEGEGDEAKDEKEVESDEKYARRILRADEKSAKTKPIVKKDLEDTVWMHHLYHDLGRYTYHKLVRYVEWTKDELNSPTRAFDTLSRFLDGLLDLHQNPRVIVDLETENALLKTQLEIAQQGWMLERVLKKAALERGEVLLRHMDRDALEAATKEFMATGLLEFTPEILERIRRGELEGEMGEMGEMEA